MPQSSHYGSHRVLRNLLPKHKRKVPPTLEDDINFGQIQTDHMVVCDFLPSKGGWQPIEVLPYGTFEMSPDSVAFHYGQQIFEGMKAYLPQDSAPTRRLYLFRPEINANRFFNSAKLVGMEPVPVDLFIQAIKELLSVEHRWALPFPGSLYIRPALIPLDRGVSYRASQAYRFFVILSPSKSYFSNETGISVVIERKDVRAFPGGVGEAKCGGNYAAALPALLRARKLGADQVLWLDGIHRRFVEEVGAMNVMFVQNGQILTPALSGSILHGVTRSSLIQLAGQLGIPVSESSIDINEILKGIEAGTIQEVFGCGTAAVISPIGSLLDQGKTYAVGDSKAGPVTIRLKNELTKIQNGMLPDPFSWRVAIDCFAN
jgi:branched-chain amino acid aminotransferase